MPSPWRKSFLRNRIDDFTGNIVVNKQTGQDPLPLVHPEMNRAYLPVLSTNLPVPNDTAITLAHVLLFKDQQHVSIYIHPSRLKEKENYEKISAYYTHFNIELWNCLCCGW